MKNIIVIDVYGQFIESSVQKGYNIKLAVVDSKNQVEEYKKKYNDCIENYYYRAPYTNQEFNLMNDTDYDLTYEDIEKYRATQLKVEHFIHREINDLNTMQDRYYTALRYFLGFFKKNKIDFVFVGHIEHGGVWDSLIMDIAKSMNIPIFINSVISSNATERINCLLSVINGKKDFLPVKFNDSFKSHFDGFLEKVKNDAKKNNQKKHYTFRKGFSFFKYIFINIYEIFCSFYRNKCKMDDRYIHQMSFYKNEKLPSEIYIKNLLKFYNEISVNPDIENTKYIFYPLHQDPEATTLVRTTLSCQLYIIELISKYLPKGWKLYVKEHPAVFFVYKYAPYFYKNIEFFRSIDFYKRIKQLENVELVSLDVSTQKLIKKSQAVTSITGTVLIEAILEKLPVLIWGYNSTILEKMKDPFCVTSVKSLIDALNKIEAGFKPSYADFNDIFNKYTYFSSDNQKIDVYANIIEKLFKEDNINVKT